MEWLYQRQRGTRKKKQNLCIPAGISQYFQEKTQSDTNPRKEEFKYLSTDLQRSVDKVVPYG